MLPGRYVFVEDFPLTPNGKVDRKALMVQASAETTPAIPSSEGLEAKVLALWSELLGTTVTDPLVNFFDLGGNSIQLAVMHVRLREISGRDFPITDLFAMPTARAISAHLSNETRSSGTHAAQDRARLAKAGFSRFQRPIPR